MEYQGTIERVTEPLFEYAGHVMAVKIIADKIGDSFENFRVEVESMLSVDLGDFGTYPKHFAEGEASDLLADELEGNQKSWGTLDSVENMVRQSVKILIKNGYLNEVGI